MTEHLRDEEPPEEIPATNLRGEAMGSQPNLSPIIPEERWEQLEVPHREHVFTQIIAGESSPLGLIWRDGQPIIYEMNQGEWSEVGALPEGSLEQRSSSPLQLVEGELGELLLADARARLWVRAEAQWRRAEVPWPTDHGVHRLWKQGDVIYAVEAAPDQLHASDPKMTLWERARGQWSHVHDKGFMIIDYLPLPDALVHAMHYGWLSVSRDGGKTWEPQTDGPLHHGAPELFRHGDHVWTITHQGIWRAGLDVQSWELAAPGSGLLYAHHDETVYVYDPRSSMLRFGSVEVIERGFEHELQVDAPISGLAPFRSGVLASGPDGSMVLYARDGGRDVHAPGASVVQVVDYKGALFARADDGSVWRGGLEGGWSALPLAAARQLLATRRGLLIMNDHEVAWWRDDMIVRRAPLPELGTAPPQLLAHDGVVLYRVGGRIWSLREGDERWSSLTQLRSSTVRVDQRDGMLVAVDDGDVRVSGDFGRSWGRATRLDSNCAGESSHLIAAPWIIAQSACGVMLYKVDPETFAVTKVPSMLGLRGFGGAGVVAVERHDGALFIVDDVGMIWRVSGEERPVAWARMPAGVASLASVGELVAIGGGALYRLVSE